IIFTGSSETPDECGMSSVVTEDINEKIYLNSFCFGYRLNDTEIYNPHFLKHLFRSCELRKLISKTASGVTRFNVSKKRFGNIEIPIPPLEVQNEIVRILDTFTSHAAKLQAELQARKEQYEYYRNKLLTFDENDEGVKWMKLGEICDILTGFPFDSSKFVAEGIRLMRGVNIKRGMLDFNEEINRYWDNSEGLEKYILEENDIVISMDGSLVGKSFAVILKEHLPLLLVQRVARLRSASVNIKYVYFNITNSFSEYVDKVKTKGAIPHISLKDISNFMIPVPPLSEQQRIVSILDKFESLVNDLTAGLPAEIAAVQEQYEYYRNKLLTFKRIS
ncbi:restriction endonuclease subunit S, partial [Bacteroides caecigallinarum]|uniref:restriction endonuclease subunit S n=1 Tax=Bacteroides caecigallinarum TaxID=1411144 RepID=UPI001F3294D4